MLFVEEDSGGWVGRIGEKDGLVLVKGGRSGGEMIERLIGGGGWVCDVLVFVGLFKMDFWELCIFCLFVSRFFFLFFGLGFLGFLDELLFFF